MPFPMGRVCYYHYVVVHAGVPAAWGKVSRGVCIHVVAHCDEVFFELPVASVAYGLCLSRFLWGDTVTKG